MLQPFCASISHTQNLTKFHFFLKLSIVPENPEIAELSPPALDIKARHEIELEGIDYFVRFMGVLGLPRSVGEIYGLLYFSSEPLSMDAIVKRLGMSLGSASQGLRTLRSFKAIKTTYVLGKRKDHYVAETEFRNLIGAYIKEEIMPHLDSAGQRIDRMESHLQAIEDKGDQQFLATRLQKLSRLKKGAAAVLPTLVGLLKL
jgi:DNA-binding transcriptional regulator GbsR (MarR family)